MEQKKPLPMQLMCVCQGHFWFSHVHEAMAMSAAHVHSELSQLEQEEQCMLRCMHLIVGIWNV